MAEEQKSFTAPGVRWSQEIALDALGDPSEFRWAQAVALGCGGDDSQWMATIRDGLSKGARVGVLAVSGAGLAYGELIGDTKTFSGKPKRNHPRWSLLARSTDITDLRYRPYARCAHRPYSELTVVTKGGERRFGIDWCAEVDQFVDQARTLVGLPRPTAPTGASWRSDGVYVAGRNRDDMWKVLAYDEANARVGYFAWGNPGRVWARVTEEPDEVSWMDVRPQGDGTFRYGEKAVQVVPGADCIHTFYDDWPAFRRWDFFGAAELAEIREHKIAGLSPKPGTPTLEGNQVVVVGYESYRTAEELEAENAARGPVPVSDYVTSAANASIKRGGGFFSPKLFEIYMPLIFMDAHDGDRVDLCMPIVVEVGASHAPVGSGGDPDKYRPSGKLETGIVTTFDDRMLLTWTEGTIRMEPQLVRIPYDAIAEVNTFDLYAKLSKIPALEVLTTDGDRHVITFTNHPDCKADFAWWQDVLSKRLRGDYVPVFDGADVLRWQRTGS